MAGNNSVFQSIAILHPKIASMHSFLLDTSEFLNDISHMGTIPVSYVAWMCVQQCDLLGEAALNSSGDRSALWVWHTGGFHGRCWHSFARIRVFIWYCGHDVPDVPT